ncbi:MAG: amylo-alpha-1,6-glucosidase, partial [Euzebyales bacterium]|nr:amylo-alpha-1,6-glucosidase [Euzebyales bacterium]
VMLLAAVHRWGAADDDVRALLPAARAAVRWCVEHGDLDGDGFVEYRADLKGLANQGWKDSGDAMVHADGSLAPGPVAPVEVQAYLYGAYVGLAQLEQRLGQPAAADGLLERAERLRASFARHFWLPTEGLVAMALDGDKRPLVVASSNIGHCLWTGLLDGDAAEAACARLAAPDLATAWGVRTLGRGERAYNPLGYHLGTVWPHDSAIAAAGLMRAGHPQAASRVTAGLLEACEAFGWRLPELFAGLDAGEVPFPVPYPVACSPQAWSAAAPLLLLRTALRLDPDVPAGSVTVAPVLPDDVELTVTGIRLGDADLDLRVRGSDVQVLGAPSGLDVKVG